MNPKIPGEINLKYGEMLIAEGVAYLDENGEYRYTDEATATIAEMIESIPKYKDILKGSPN